MSSPLEVPMKRTGAAMTVLVGGVASVTGILAAIGVFGRSGESATVTSVRGETYRMTTSGVYAFNAQRVVAEGIGWDVFTLFFVVPALFASMPLLARGSFRARLVVLGLFAYLFYQYLMYALTWAFGPLLLPFIALFALSLSGSVWIASSLARESLTSRFDERFPRRGMAALCFVLAFALVAMWLQRIAVGLRGDLAGAMLLGQTTLVVQALDLGLVVPLAIFTGVKVLQRGPVGAILASVVAVKAVAMASAICAMVIAAWRVEGRLDVAPLTLFGGAAVVALLLVVRMLRSTREDPARGPVET